MAYGPDNRYTPGQPAGGWTNPAAGYGYGAQAADTAAIDAGLRSYMLRVYNWMASGLLLTGIIAYVIAHSPGISKAFWTVGRTASGLVAVQPTLLGWAAILSPLVFVLVLSFGINRLSKTAAQGVFWAFCAAMGASMSNIFLLYVGTSIASTFFVTAGTFAAMSLIGYTTKRDLTAMGSFLLMGLIGIILASVVNIFMQSAALAFAVSILGVLIFVGLIAYDTQRIKNDYIQFSYAEGTDEAGKRSVMDALALYLNFVNLFQFLLSLMGQRNSN